MTKVKRLMKSLRRNSSGNVLMIMALGMPVFVGGAGLAVDTAQWYMWKREMQYAVDQAALAGAWSRVGGSEGNVYQTRARQELTANLQVVDFEGTPSITLAKWNTTGADNSVLVTLSATKTLPFSSMLMNHGATISVRAQASFTKARTFTACLIAVDPTTSGAITIGGSAYVVANCGAAALSNNPNAVIRNGNPTFDVGYIVAAGGIDDDFDGDPNLQIFENQTGLVDPFASLSPPNNPTPRTYACVDGSTVTIAVTNKTTTIVDKLYTASSASGPWTLSSTTSIASSGEAGTQEVPSTTKRNDILSDATSTAAGAVQTIPGTPAKTTTTCNSQGKACKTTTTPATPTTYKRTDRVTTVTVKVDSVSSHGKNPGAALLPGTYPSMVISCPTTMAKGVYVIDGGLFKINAQDTIVGRGVMFVLKNGAGIEINGGATLDLRAMTQEEMVLYGGMTNEQALKLKEMLIFEDRNSPGHAGNSVNGNAGAILEGTVYLPKSDIKFNGTFGVVSRCLVITAKTITIEGNANMTSFCPSGVTNTVSVGGGVTSVKLVA